MTFQALLFCEDEKTARVTTQVLNDLEFSVETCNEPFAAVKKLMGQHFDAIVVDCNNEQNATLLFKSARNSTANQSSLAVAVVEGQSGVANAFRIGANLVLTKPINVEQAKGTLRVARGLLKKSGESAKPAVSPAAVAAPSTPPFEAPIVAEPVRPSTPAPLMSKPPAPAPSAKPVMASAASKPSADAAELFEIQAGPTPAPADEILLTALDEPVPAKKPVPVATSNASEKGRSWPSGPAAATPAPKLTPRGGDEVAASPKPTVVTGGAASAPAPAKETPKAPAAKVEAPVREEKRAQIGLPVSAAGTGVVRVSASDRQSAPSFAQLGSSDKSEGSGGGKIAIVAIVLVAIAAGGYFGYTKLHQQSSAPTVETPQQPEMAVPAPNATTAATSGTFTVSMQKAAEAAETAPSVSATPTSHKPDAGKVIDSEPEVVVTKIEPKPTVVKSASHGASKPQEADVQAPEMLAATGSDQSAISSIMSSAPLSVPVAAPVPSPMLKVSQGVTQGLLMKRVQPIYPRQAMQMHISGSVQLQAVISKTGSISSMKTLSGDPVLAHAAMDAVKQWKYKPYMLDGEPVDIQTQVTVNFKLP